MEIWRKEAIDLFSELNADLREEDYSIYQLFFDLLPMTFEAHNRGDQDLLRRAYGFTTWCFSQEDKELWNPAAVAFFEHVFDNWSQRKRVIPWLSPDVVRDCWELWETRLSVAQCTELRQLLNKCTDEAWKTAQQPKPPATR